jgi:hypothetical protein
MKAMVAILIGYIVMFVAVITSTSILGMCSVVIVSIAATWEDI